MKRRNERLFGGVEETPDRGTAIGVRGEGTEGVTGLEREVLLYGVYGGEVVVFYFAELEKARWCVRSWGFSYFTRWWRWWELTFRRA